MINQSGPPWYILCGVGTYLSFSVRQCIAGFPQKLTSEIRIWEQGVYLGGNPRSGESQTRKREKPIKSTRMSKLLRQEIGAQSCQGTSRNIH